MLRRHLIIDAFRAMMRSARDSFGKGLFGPPNPFPKPPDKIPAELLERFTLGGKVEIVPAYVDSTYPSNYPLVYTDEEINEYTRVIKENLSKPPDEQDWFIYGTLDRRTCEAIQKYPIAGKSVVNMGSLTPWYESMFIHRLPLLMAGWEWIDSFGFSESDP
jgi:hypothetical protein